VKRERNNKKNTRETRHENEVTEKKIKTDGGEIAMGAIRGADVDH
jgi:hypothetical protein